MRSRRLLEWVAAVLAGAAGVIHLRYAQVHLHVDSIHGLFFYVTGFLQLELALLLIVARRRPAALFWSAIAGNAAVALVWAQTRFVSVPFGAGAGSREAIGLADLTATALEVGIVVTLLPLVSRVRLAAFTERAISGRAAGAALTAVAFAALPLTTAAALVGPAGHRHDHEAADGHHHHANDSAAHKEHARAADHSHAATDAVDHAHTGPDALAHLVTAHASDASHASDAGHAHTAASATGGTAHSHPADASAPPGTAPHDHTTEPLPPGTPPHDHTTDPTGPVISISDPRLTAAQRQAAMVLLGGTEAALAAYPTVADVEAAGYESIGDDVTGFVHYVNWNYLADGHEFDPARIESIVAQVNPDGTRSVVSGLYIMEVGKSMADIPDIAGPLTQPYFHIHTNLCFAGHRLAGLAVNGVCPAGSILLITPPMIHVWQVPRPCGPFDTIEGHGSTDCGQHTH